MVKQWRIPAILKVIRERPRSDEVLPKEIVRPGDNAPESAPEQEFTPEPTPESEPALEQQPEQQLEQQPEAEQQPGPSIPGVAPNEPAVDVAYAILKSAGESLDYRELLDRIVEFKRIVSDDLAKAMSRLYTEINLDPRFVYIGAGSWGLKEWLPKPQAARSMSAQAIAQKSKHADRWHEDSASDEPEAPRRPDEEDEDWSPEPD